MQCGVGDFQAEIVTAQHLSDKASRQHCVIAQYLVVVAERQVGRAAHRGEDVVLMACIAVCFLMAAHQHEQAPLSARHTLHVHLTHASISVPISVVFLLLLLLLVLLLLMMLAVLVARPFSLTLMLPLSYRTRYSM